MTIPVTKIAENLFLGGMPKSIEAYQYVISVGEKPSYSIGLGKVVVVAPLQDTHRMPDEDHLMSLATMVNEFTAKGPTLVHCTMGMNRSALIVTLALMQRGKRVGETVTMLRKTRHLQVLQNDTFLEGLMEIGHKYRGVNGC